MRRPTWTLFAAVAVGLAGCTAGPPGPAAITDIAGPVIGYVGASDVDYEARATTQPTVVATGTLDAASSTFSAAFDVVADDEVHTMDDVVAPMLGKGGSCDVSVTPSDLEIAIVDSFTGGDGSLLILAEHDPWAIGPPAPGDTHYRFVFATRDGRVDGSCTDHKGNGTTFAMRLARGWNPVALTVLAVGEDFDVDRRWSTQMPGGDARWWYRAQVKVIIERRRARRPCRARDRRRGAPGLRQPPRDRPLGR